jgi:hypothetical protein
MVITVPDIELKDISCYQILFLMHTSIDGSLTFHTYVDQILFLMHTVVKTNG